MNKTLKSHPDNLVVDVCIETRRGSFIKRGAGGKIEFLSFFPCPFNYGSIPTYTAADGDSLDAVVLGPRLRRGTRIRVPVMGAIAFLDHGVSDDKLICGGNPIGAVQRSWILLFFRFYALCKRLNQLLRGRRYACRCLGWCDIPTALKRTQSPSDEAEESTAGE
jgi:inorganic pyrophosphatase